MNLSYEFVRHAREISGGDLVAINRLLKQLEPPVEGVDHD